LFGPGLHRLPNSSHHFLNIEDFEPFNDPEKLNEVETSVDLIFANMEEEVERYERNHIVVECFGVHVFLCDTQQVLHRHLFSVRNEISCELDVNMEAKHHLNAHEVRGQALVKRIVTERSHPRIDITAYAAVDHVYKTLHLHE
jgi:hypothetical protein